MLERCAERTNWQRVFRTRGIAMRQQHQGNQNRLAVVQSSGGDGKDGIGALAAQRVGWFRFYFDDDRWEWSLQVEKMHGYLPGSVTPNTEIVLSHKHPDDYRHIADTLDLIRHTRRAYRAVTYRAGSGEAADAGNNVAPKAPATATVRMVAKPRYWPATIRAVERGDRRPGRRTAPIPECRRCW
jgi:hypothetical protein